MLQPIVELLPNAMSNYITDINRLPLCGSLLLRSDIFLLHRLFQARSRGGVQTKTFRKGSEASSRAERRYGYVILVSSEPRCYHAATSERRRIRLKADYYYIALRGASFRRSQRGNSEAVFFRGILPRRYSIRRSQRGNSEAFFFVGRYLGNNILHKTAW